MRVFTPGLLALVLAFWSGPAQSEVTLDCPAFHSQDNKHELARLSPEPLPNSSKIHQPTPSWPLYSCGSRNFCLDYVDLNSEDPTKWEAARLEIDPQGRLVKISPIELRGIKDQRLSAYVKWQLKDSLQPVNKAIAHEKLVLKALLHDIEEVRARRYPARPTAEDKKAYAFTESVKVQALLKRLSGGQEILANELSKSPSPEIPALSLGLYKNDMPTTPDQAPLAEKEKHPLFQLGDIPATQRIASESSLQEARSEANQKSRFSEESARPAPGIVKFRFPRALSTKIEDLVEGVRRAAGCFTDEKSAPSPIELKSENGNPSTKGHH